MPSTPAKPLTVECEAAAHISALPEIRLLRALRDLLCGDTLTREFAKALARTVVVLALVFGPNAHFAFAQSAAFDLALEFICGAPADVEALEHVHSLASGSAEHHDLGACHACRVKLALLPPAPLAFTFVKFQTFDATPVFEADDVRRDPALRDAHPPRAPPRAV